MEFSFPEFPGPLSVWVGFVNLPLPDTISFFINTCDAYPSPPSIAIRNRLLTSIHVFIIFVLLLLLLLSLFCFLESQILVPAVDGLAAHQICDSASNGGALVPAEDA